MWSVDGRALTKADLGDFVLRYMPERAAEAIDQMLDEAVIAAEARREGVALSEETVRARTDAFLDAKRREARAQHGKDADFGALLRERLGRDLAAWRRDAERLVRALLLRDRLVRLDQFREDGVEVRVLVAPDEAAALAAAESVRNGADMTLYAERMGLRRPASPAPAARGEIPEKDLEAKLFAAQAGEVLAPVPFETPSSGRWWQVFKVVRAWRGSAEPWTSIAARVERSLDAAVSEEEYRRWRRRAYARHAVKGSPAEGGGPIIPR